MDENTKGDHGHETEGNKLTIFALTEIQTTVTTAKALSQGPLRDDFLKTGTRDQVEILRTSQVLTDLARMSIHEIISYLSRENISDDQLEVIEQETRTALENELKASQD